MVKGLYTAYTGLRNEQNRMDVMTNNLANASTVGYKKEGTTSQSFSSVLAVKVKDASVGVGTVRRIGVNDPGVKIGENYIDYTQGSFRDTGNTFDLALAGEGFFAVEFTNKAGNTDVKYTRAGNFTLDSAGNLVTSDGDYVLGKNGSHITIDPLKDAAIDTNGSIWQDGRIVGEIGVYDFEDYGYLTRYGETYFEAEEGATLKEGTAQIQSGYLEMSNIQVVSEMVNLIAITRQFESAQKVMQTIDNTLEKAVNEVGRSR